MLGSSIYRLHGPSAWPAKPERFSFSSLAAIEVCPLQWQLVHAHYEDLAQFPARPHPAAVEGSIVHQVLDLLFKSLALAGLPEFGTTEFRQEVARVDLRGTVDQLIAEHESRIATHPRRAGFRLRVGSQQLVNQAIRLFRAEYVNAVAEPASFPEGRPISPPGEVSGRDLLDLLRSRGALSELHLAHPELPFAGIIDLVRTADDGIVVLDFKTGQIKPNHLAQVLAYAILWWRTTGRPPLRIEVRYPTGVEALAVGERSLVEGERELRLRIERLVAALCEPPASARLGEHCRYCDVRQFCDAYWTNGLDELGAKKTKERSSIDIELTVAGQPSSNGFPARSQSGSGYTVVHASDSTKVHGPFAEGEDLRILNGRLSDTDAAIELMRWTEVFHR